MIHENLKNTLKDALKSKDEVTLRTIRSLITACTNELVATRRTPQEFLSDDEVLTVIKRLVKQRKDSITQYETANRHDLAVVEKEELVVLEKYLPAMLTRDEIKIIVAQKIAEIGTPDKSKIGMFVGQIMKELAGKADGSDVKAVIEELVK